MKKPGHEKRSWTSNEERENLERQQKLQQEEDKGEGTLFCSQVSPGRPGGGEESKRVIRRPHRHTPELWGSTLWPVLSEHSP